MFPRVKDIVRAYSDGGTENVKKYFEQENLKVDPSTWSGNIKKCLDDNLDRTAATELQLMLEKFNFYKNVSEEKERSRTRTIIGKGHKEFKGETSQGQKD